MKATGWKDRIDTIQQETDPLELNAMAMQCGIDYATAKREAADLESQRRIIYEEVRKDVEARMQAETGKVVLSRVDDLVRSDPRYIEYLTGCNAATYSRDILEAVWKGVHQRASLLAFVAPEA